MRNILKTISIVVLILALFSCNKKIDQSSMFNGRDHKTKKRGVYDAGLNSKKPVSVQIAKEYDKMSKNDTDPKKAAKKENKSLEKKKRAANKVRAKHNKKTRVKVKTTKGKAGGDS
jgi:hypothetical protein